MSSQVAHLAMKRQAELHPDNLYSISLDRMLQVFKERLYVSDDIKLRIINTIQHEDGSGRKYNLVFSDGRQCFIEFDAVSRSRTNNLVVFTNSR